MTKDEALKHVDTLLKVALDSYDVDAIHKVLEEARKIVAKAKTTKA
ncbi:hypothetical protein [Bradyrhizobium yuanmingense]|nr:hypothetical protein [Bradyrhizobium yuanmingense]